MNLQEAPLLRLRKDPDTKLPLRTDPETQNPIHTVDLYTALNAWREACLADELDGAVILKHADAVHDRLASLAALERMQIESPGRPPEVRVKKLVPKSKLLTVFLTYFGRAASGASQPGVREVVSPQISQLRDHRLSAEKPQLDPNPLAA